MIGSISSVSLVKLIPGLGTVIGGATASVAGAAATYALGRVFTQHFDQGGTLLDFDPISSREYFQKEFESGGAFIAKQDLIAQEMPNGTATPATALAIAATATVSSAVQEKALLEKETSQLYAALEQLQISISNLQATHKTATSITKVSDATELVARKPSPAKTTDNLSQATTKKSKATLSDTAEKNTPKSTANTADSSATSNTDSSSLLDQTNEGALNKVADFTIIEGIGAKIDAALKNAGIYSMENLSTLKLSRLKQVLKDAPNNFNFVDPTSWPLQATLAASGKMTELKKLQDELIGGRTKRK